MCELSDIFGGLVQKYRIFLHQGGCLWGSTSVAALLTVVCASHMCIVSLLFTSSFLLMLTRLIVTYASLDDMYFIYFVVYMIEEILCSHMLWTFKCDHHHTK